MMLAWSPRVPRSLASGGPPWCSEARAASSRDEGSEQPEAPRIGARAGAVRSARGCRPALAGVPRSDAEDPLDPFPMRLAVRLHRRTGERPQQLLEAHHPLERRAVVVAGTEAVAVHHHVGAAVDARSSRTLTKTPQVRSVLHRERGRVRLADVQL